MLSNKDVSHDKPLVLIPAAGFGTRMGSPEAKEMLPLREGRPLIELPLEIARTRRWPLLVITRPEKRSLIEYLKNQLPSLSDLSMQMVGPTSDWPETLLLSQPHWHERNLLVLPDSSWAPLTIVDSLIKALHECEITWAEHFQASLTSWGTIVSDGSSRLKICEKPQDSGSGWAWGLMAFRPKAGIALLQAQRQSAIDHQWRTVEARHQSFRLNHFADLTRG